LLGAALLWMPQEDGEWPGLGDRGRCRWFSRPDLKVPHGLESAGDGRAAAAVRSIPRVPTFICPQLPRYRRTRAIAAMITVDLRGGDRTRQRGRLSFTRKSQKFGLQLLANFAAM
jgi:hypothetical protein